MPSGVVNVGGKQFTLDQQIIDAGVPAIRAALAIDVPDIENAEIVIDEPVRVGEPRTASIVKRGMGKGGGSPLSPAQQHVLDVLSRADEYVNPAVKLAEAIQRAELNGDGEAFVESLRTGEMARAVAAGEREGRAVHQAVVALAYAQPVPSLVVPEGF
jgi:hypothetical protein